MLSSAEFSNSNSLLVDNKPTKMATCSKDKSVLVTVYVEKPQVRAFSNHQSHHHHHHSYLHQIIKKELIQHKHRGAGNGYSRRALLLHYSQRLRESARLASSSPLQSKPVSSNDLQPSNKIIAVQRKPTNSNTPACFDNWRILIPSFLRSLMNLQAKNPEKKKKNGGFKSSNDKKTKAAMKSLQVQKNWRLIFSKPISMLRKSR